MLRDDLLPGGTKRRAAHVILDGRPAVYAGPAEGYAQVALAHTCADVGIPFTSIVPQRIKEHRSTALARSAGAWIIPLKPGYLSQLRSYAAHFAEVDNQQLIPFGLNDPDFKEALVNIIDVTLHNLKPTPSEVWCVAGSGVLAHCISRAVPDIPLRIVQVGGRIRTILPESTRIYPAPEAFSQDAKYPPPFPSCPTYDAKAWQFVSALALDNALFWNVA